MILIKAFVRFPHLFKNKKQKQRAKASFIISFSTVSTNINVSSCENDDNNFDGSFFDARPCTIQGEDLFFRCYL